MIAALLKLYTEFSFYNRQSQNQKLYRKLALKTLSDIVYVFFDPIFPDFDSVQDYTLLC